MADDFQPENAAAPSTDERVAYCQDCGKPLTAATVRHVGQGVFCEPCLIRRVGPAAPGSAYSGGFGTPTAAPGSTPAAHLPNPTLAGFLGLIPGVGAMYNGQFAKGIAHLVIFFVLSSLSDHINGAFAILVAGWIFYQAFEAYHTAKARLMGAPLPNPLGLNDIGDRMGFGKTWTGWTPGTPAQSGPATPPNPGPTAWTAPPAEPPPATPWTTTPVQPVPPAPVPPVPPANWTGYIPPEAFATTPAAPLAASYSVPPTTAPYTATYSAPVDPATGLPTAPVPQRRFPVAAIVLIGFGLLALLDTTLHLDLNGSWIAAFVLAAVALWSFAHRISQLHRDHPEGVDPTVYAACLLRWPPLMCAVLAVLFALQAANLYTLGQTWAVIVIAFGAALLAQRSFERAAPPVPPQYVVDPLASSQPYAAPQPSVSSYDDGGQR